MDPRPPLPLPRRNDWHRSRADGRRQLVLTGVELLEKLVPLIPPTYANLTRFHGVFAPTSRLRAELAPTKLQRRRPTRRRRRRQR